MCRDGICIIDRYAGRYGCLLVIVRYVLCSAVILPKTTRLNRGDDQ